MLGGLWCKPNQLLQYHTILSTQGHFEAVEKDVDALREALDSLQDLVTKRDGQGTRYK